METGLLILIIVVSLARRDDRPQARVVRLLMVLIEHPAHARDPCVVFGVSTLHYLFPMVSANSVLLPMVILTILIERFHVTVEEDGLMFALQLTRVLWLLPTLCFAVLGWDEVGAWVLTYPTSSPSQRLSCWCYAGYRLTELWRFCDLVEPGEPIR